MLLQGSVLAVAWEHSNKSLDWNWVWVSRPRICQECSVGTSAFHTSPYLSHPHRLASPVLATTYLKMVSPLGKARENMGSTSSLEHTWPGQAEGD